MAAFVNTNYIPREDTMLAVSILENLAKVLRFDLIIMCLSSMHKSGKFDLATLCYLHLSIMPGSYLLSGHS